MAAIVLAVLLLAAGAAVALVISKATLSADSTALAKVGLPLGGGTIESVSVVTGPHSRPVQVNLKGHQLWPQAQIAAGQQVSVEVVVKRPGWVSWLTGKTQRLQLTLTTPKATVRHRYLTVRNSAPLRVGFTQPVATVFYGSSASGLKTRLLDGTQSRVTLPKGSEAGSLWVAAVPRTWETAKPQLISWFPAGSGASAVAYPSPGTTIKPNTPLTLTFSKPISKALGNTMPPVTPATAGAWHTLNDHSIVFRPEGYGYGLGAHVSIALPHDVRLVGGQDGGTSDAGRWSVPAGSTLRLQQLLATLGYLPLQFKSKDAAPAMTPSAQEDAAVKPPAGDFTWRYGNVPSALRGFWAPGAAGVMTRGALMAFENDNGLTADGIAGPQVWKALIGAAVNGKHSTFGYTFVSVSESSQSLDLWHNGHTVLTTPVNTGIASAPTATGTYPVYEHISSGTMSGTNPDGSHYNDPGVPWISYFNGGDALHGFTRAQFGFPQSLGCVEIPPVTAGHVWPYTPIGTLVHVV
ncbi:MAG TPA: L,D-transpeptidase family protein [Solirubrobacteraceae bacterium]|nr:L,D-transpeptidase family protein [Solirubrobacteraceae bacterium]